MAGTVEPITTIREDGLGVFSILSISLNVYDIPTVLRTAYWFTDRVYMQVRKKENSPDILEVLFRPKDPEAGLPDGIAEEFCNALIDQSVRDLVQRETQEIQNVIVKRAFSEALTPGEQRLEESLGR